MTKTARAERLKKPRLKVVTMMERKSITGKESAIGGVYHKYLPAVVLTILIFFFFVRLFYPQQSLFMIPDFGESDVLHLNLPLKEILSRGLKNHQWPLWTDTLAGGFPILAEGQIGTFYLPNLVLFRFLPTVTAYNLNLLIAYIICATGSYLLGRKNNLSPVASVFSAMVFTFGGFLAVHLNHFNLIQAATLAPLVFLTAGNLWHKPSFLKTTALSFVISQQFFTGHFYTVFITLIGVTVYIISLSIIKTKNITEKNTAKKLGFFIIALLFTLGLSAIQLFPSLALWEKSTRAQGLDFDTVTSYPYAPQNILTFFSPYYFGSPGNGTYPVFNNEWGIFWENTAYVGLLPLFLAIFSIMLFKRKQVRIWLGILLISFLLVLGKYSPLYFIFAAFPFNLFRVPSKFLLLVALSLSMLAGFGFDQILSFLPQPKTGIKNSWPKLTRSSAFYTAIFIILTFSLVIIDEYRFSYSYPPTSPASSFMDRPPILSHLTDTNARILSIGASGIWNDVFLKKGWQDMTPFIFFRNSLYPNYNAIYGLRQADINTGGLVPKRTTYFTNLLQFQESTPSNKIASPSKTFNNASSIASVKYLISPIKLPHPFFLLEGKLEPPKELELAPFYVFQNPHFYPLAYLIHSSEKITTLEDFYKKISLDDFTRQKKVLVENDELVFNEMENSAGEILEKYRSHQKIVLDVVLTRQSLLVETGANDPDWQATIDGKPTKIYNVNLFQKGILVPQGKHRVNFFYHDSSFRTGKTVTAIAMVTIFLVLSLWPFLSAQKFSGNNRRFSGHYDIKGN